MTDTEVEFQTLRQTEIRLNALLDAARDYAVVEMDEQGIVAHASAGAERVLGWREDELIGLYVGVFFTEEDRRAEVPRLEMTLARERGRALNERWHARKDGSLFYGSGFFYPVEGGGYVKVFQDRTNEVRREAELQHTVAELQVANAELQTFVYSVSHDLRAPLRAVSATSAMLQEELREASPEVRALLERQGRAVRRMGSLMDALLSLSRLARTEMSNAEVNLAGIARATAASLGEVCAEVEFQIPAAIPAHGDARFLSLLLQSLLENACKFSPDGGRVGVGETRIEGERRFYVRDEGIGFDMAHASRLFLPFERLVREDEFPGTGIGLASAKRIVERHGGRIWAESEPGKGSTFWFTLKEE